MIPLKPSPPVKVGEIEEQLTSARRELARSEEANQKLQRDLKEVRLAVLTTDHKPPLRVAVIVASACLSVHNRFLQFSMVTNR